MLKHKIDHVGDTLTAEDMNRILSFLKEDSDINPALHIPAVKFEDAEIVITDTYGNTVPDKTVVALTLPLGKSLSNYAIVLFNGIPYRITMSDSRPFKENSTGTYIVTLYTSGNGDKFAIVQNTVGEDGRDGEKAPYGERGYRGRVLGNVDRLINGLRLEDTAHLDHVPIKVLKDNGKGELLAYGADCFFTYSNDISLNIKLKALRNAFYSRESDIPFLKGNRGVYCFRLEAGTSPAVGKTVIPISQHVELNREADIVTATPWFDTLYLNFAFEVRTKNGGNTNGDYAAIVIDYVTGEYIIKRFTYENGLAENKEQKFSIPFPVTRSAYAEPESGVRFNVQLCTLSSGQIVEEGVKHELSSSTVRGIVLDRTISGLKDWSKIDPVAISLNFSELSFTSVPMSEHKWRSYVEDTDLVKRYIEPIRPFRIFNVIASQPVVLDLPIRKYRPRSGILQSYIGNSTFWNDTYPDLVEPHNTWSKATKYILDPATLGNLHHIYPLTTGSVALGNSLNYSVKRQHAFVYYTDLAGIGKDTLYTNKGKEEIFV